MTRFVCLATAAAALSLSAPAAAGVFELEAQIQTGGMAGQGLYGDLKDEAYHDYAKGYTYGFLVGGELLFVDGWIEHNQSFDGEVIGTWTQFMLGFDLNFDLGEPEVGAGDEEESYARAWAEIGFGLGYGVATRDQVMPPLSNDELSDQAFIGQVDLDFGYRLNKVFSVGLHLPLQYGHSVLSIDDDDVANDLDNNYGFFNGAALVFMRANLSLTD